MKRGFTRGRPTKKPVVVLAGEDSSDRKCLRILLESFCPDMRGRIVEITDSVRLRQATGPELKRRVNTIAIKAKARAKRDEAEIACIFIHEDMDAIDSDDYPKTRERVQQALDSCLPSAHYVLTVWEIEAWLLLFPDALTAFAASWGVPPKYRSADTGKISDPKQVLQAMSKTTQREYRPSEAPRVFELAVEQGLSRQPTGSNRSWKKFEKDARHCCVEHIGR